MLLRSCSIFTSYIGSNYLFDLNKVQGLDALEFGNPSRFINQPEVRDGVLVGQPNCYARSTSWRALPFLLSL
jgi:hypothetical protein